MGIILDGSTKVEGFTKINNPEDISTIAAQEGDIVFIPDNNTWYIYRANSGENIDDLFILETLEGGDSRWVAISGKYKAIDLNISKQIIMNNVKTNSSSSSCNTGTTNVDSFSFSEYKSAEYDYYLTDGTSYRAGELRITSDGNTVVFTENTTTDIGNTIGVSFSADAVLDLVFLRATCTTDGWTINLKKEYIG